MQVLFKQTRKQPVAYGGSISSDVYEKGGGGGCQNLKNGKKDSIKKKISSWRRVGVKTTSLTPLAHGPV